MRQVGGSLNVALDKAWLRERGIQVGDEVVLFYETDEVVIQALDETPPREASS